MRKVILISLFLLLVFSTTVKAEEVISGEAGSTVPVYDIRYNTTLFTFNLIVDNAIVYQVDFGVKEVFPGDYIILTVDQLASALQGPPYNVKDGKKEYDNLKKKGLKVSCVATIVIFDINNPSVILDTITSKDQVLPIAGARGFGEPDLTDMRDRYIENFKMEETIVIPPIIPPTNKSHMTLVAELKEFADNDISNKKNHLVNSKGIGTDPNDPLVIKAGYGIPITAELLEFNYISHTICCCTKSKYYPNTFKIDGIKTTVTTTFDDDDFWKKGSSSIWNWPGDGSGKKQTTFFPWENKKGIDKARMVLPHVDKNNYPLEKRKIYTKPNQADDLYQIQLDVKTDVSFDERYPDDGCDDCCCCCCNGPDAKCGCHCCCKGTHTERTNYTCNDSVTLWVRIQGSMFDDDQSVITQ